MPWFPSRYVWNDIEDQLDWSKSGAVVAMAWIPGFSSQETIATGFACLFDLAGFFSRLRLHNRRTELRVALSRKMIGDEPRSALSIRAPIFDGVQQQTHNLER